MIHFNLTSREAREVLKVSYGTWRSHLETIGLSTKVKVIEWETLEVLYALQLYLSLKTGQHSKADFGKLLKERGLVPIKDIIRNAGIEYEKVLLSFYVGVQQHRKAKLTSGLESTQIKRED